jgi:hypothetical protein
VKVIRPIRVHDFRSLSSVELIKPNNPSAASWRVGVEKRELARRKHDLHRLLAKRNEVADIARITALVRWMTGLLTRDDQQALEI